MSRQGIRKFDPDSGLVYQECVIPRVSISRDELDWSRKRPTPAVKPRGTRGPRSLVDTVIEVVANHIGDVTDRHLEVLPPRLVSRIWRFLEARGLCLHAWKIFSKALLPQDEERTLSLYRYRHHICQPRVELKRYIEPLTSPSVDFITHLAISGGQSFTTSEMLWLTDIRNLGVLEIIRPADELGADFPDVSDRLIRGWTERPDPFPLLRVLRIFGDESTTQKSLHWVSKFPSLVLYDVIGAREDWPTHEQEAIDQGWESARLGNMALDDSLLRYLTLFSHVDERQAKGLRELARSVDADLLSLCADSGCEVKFVPDRQAPELIDYLTDSAKIVGSLPSWERNGAATATRACHGAIFEAWAFWLYSIIGQLSNDRDLEKQGTSPGLQAVAGPFVLPSKPFASLFLGHSGRGGISLSPSYVKHGLFATKRFTFIRPSILQGKSIEQPTLNKKTATNDVNSGGQQGPAKVKSRKRKGLGDMLTSFMN
ncbi:unnamed protein product [Clonostachys rhizophaga]|uniref:Uncharacterized protein n=1 Tax=Clonostachys rhizophaga TaxID=160324 RepID=A0A9N9VT07_9HYPO|nr:unnamed protein product [Clonostachys rhizophaga]